MPGTDFVAAVLCGKADIGSLGPAHWDMLVRQGRQADLLARLAWLFEARGTLAAVHVGAAQHFRAASLLAQAQHAEVMRELAHIRNALRNVDTPIVLLKGAAYVCAGLPARAGRTFSDIDIMVPKAMLPAVEAALMMAGWVTTHHSPYDQHYYRAWMHELPPLLSIRRQTVLDVHHAIMPETARFRPPSELLFAAARPVPGHEPFAVLAPADMALHSMAHLFTNDDLSHGLRDLSDLDLLLRHFSAEPGFWPALIERARRLDLLRIAYHGLRCVERILGTPVPAATQAELAAVAPSKCLVSGFDAVWRRTLCSPHRSVADRWTPLAHAALAVRAHWLRMPLGLLLAHLAVKATGLNQPRGGAA